MHRFRVLSLLSLGLFFPTFRLLLSPAVLADGGGGHHHKCDECEQTPETPYSAVFAGTGLGVVILSRLRRPRQSGKKSARP